MRAAVSGMATASEPSTNAFGRLSRWNTKLPASVAAISSANPAGSKSLRALHEHVGAVRAQRGDASRARSRPRSGCAGSAPRRCDPCGRRSGRRAWPSPPHRPARSRRCPSSCRGRRAARAPRPRCSRARSRTRRRPRAGTTADSDEMHDLGREVEPERGADDPLPGIARRDRRPDIHAADAQERDREERSQHPRDRRVQQRADVAREPADGERGRPSRRGIAREDARDYGHAGIPPLRQRRGTGEPMVVQKSACAVAARFRTPTGRVAESRASARPAAAA